MPSKSEPCGLSQMIAMRYGTVPIVREVGGLKDTVHPYEAWRDAGNGFTFAAYNSGDMLFVIRQAVGLYRDYQEQFRRLQQRCMAGDFSWGRSAGEYVRIYCGITGQPAPQFQREEPAAAPAQPEKPPAQPEKGPEQPKLTRKPEQAKLTAKPDIISFAGGMPAPAKLAAKPEQPKLTGKPKQAKLTGKPKQAKLTGKPEQAKLAETAGQSAQSGEPEKKPRAKKTAARKPAEKKSAAAKPAAKKGSAAEKKTAADKAKE